MNRFIPIAEPALTGNEKAYVLDCMESTWISSRGQYIERFEASFAQFCGAKHALACCNGTVALHLALVALGVGPGDEVIIPALTYVATANVVVYCGARPVLVDSDPETWNMDPSLIKERLTRRTKGIIAVHLYGHPVDMEPVLTLARQNNMFVVEDAAEAHGAQYRGRSVGSIGDIAAFSFYANKIITTGQGGMVTTNSDDLMDKLRLLIDQGVDPGRRYWHTVIGYNYHMTNLAAAIGLAQLENVEWHIARRRENAAWYLEFLTDCPGLKLQVEKSWARNVYWMSSVVLAGDVSESRDDVSVNMARAGIETRPFFYPLHILPPYLDLAIGQNFPCAEYLASHGLNLPSSATLGKEDAHYISRQLINSITGSNGE